MCELYRRSFRTCTSSAVDVVAAMQRMCSTVSGYQAHADLPLFGKGFSRTTILVAAEARRIRPVEKKTPDSTQLRAVGPGVLVNREDTAAGILAALNSIIVGAGPLSDRGCLL